MLRCGTSIGANIEEAIGGFSKKDFIAKMQISYKEARETHYWLRLLNDTEFIDENMFQSLIQDCEEVLKLLSKILETSKNNMSK
ncbi:four helix bundle protein [Marinifilum sp. RC60d5]|uniref:four helix bundle protein n=1 Tax=Marinifilum sp. RC60d5 TaxID=3458414 RepID=UPI0040358608